MKKIALTLWLCLCSMNFVNSAELSVSTPKNGFTNPAEEINSSFSQSKNTNWIIHRIKPTEKKIKSKNKSSIKLNKSDEKLINEIKQDKLPAPNEGITKLKKDTSVKKETVKTAEPSKNVTKTDEKQTNKIKQEKSPLKNESVTKSKKDVPTEKETVHTTEPAQKIIKEEEKAEKLRQQQEKEKQLYRELQELSNQYQQAVALYTDNNLDESLSAFAKIPEDKRPAEAWLLMGNILMDKDKKDEAAFMYGRAILVEKTYYKAYYNLGNLYLSDDKFNMAIEQYKMAGKYNPNNPYVFYNLGCAYLKIGDLKKAKTAFIRALEIKNSIADFHYNMAYVYKKLGKEKQAKIYLDNYNKLTGEI